MIFTKQLGAATLMGATLAACTSTPKVQDNNLSYLTHVSRHVECELRTFYSGRNPAEQRWLANWAVAIKLGRERLNDGAVNPVAEIAKAPIVNGIFGLIGEVGLNKSAERQSNLEYNVLLKDLPTPTNCKQIAASGPMVAGSLELRQWADDSLDTILRVTKVINDDDSLPKISQTLEFITTQSGSASPSIEISPTTSGRTTNLKSGFSLSRVDTNNLTLTLSGAVNPRTKTSTIIQNGKSVTVIRPATGNPAAASKSATEGNAIQTLQRRINQ